LPRRFAKILRLFWGGCHVPKLDSDKFSRHHGVNDEEAKQQWVTEVIDEIEKISQKIETTPDSTTVASFAERMRKDNLTQVVQDLLLRPLRFVVFFINLTYSKDPKHAYPPYFPEPETINENEENPEVVVNEEDYVNSGELIRSSIDKLEYLKVHADTQKVCDKIDILVKKLELGWMKVLSKKNISQV
jgi:hypothetical protein